MAAHLKPSEREKILEMSREDFGNISMTARSIRIASKVGLHWKTVLGIINPSDKKKKVLTDDDARRIMDLYNADTRNVSDRVKIKDLIVETGWSSNTITILIRKSKYESNEENVIYFNPKMEMF